MQRGKDSGLICLILLLGICITYMACGNDDDAFRMPPNRIGNSVNYITDMPGVTVDTRKVREIIYPLFTVPAIIKKGESLSVKVDTGGLQPSNWSVTLASIEGSPLTFSRTLNVRGTSPGSSYWRTGSTIYDVLVDIPCDIVPAMCDMTVSYNTVYGMVSDTQPHSVCVVDEYNRDFRFVHLTDMHVGSPRNILDSTELAEAGFWSPDKSKRWLYIRKTISEVNLLNPDFVVITGDIVFGQLNPLEYVYEYEEIYRVLKEFNVPVYIVPGNHDCYAQDGMITDGQLYWTNYFGPRYFSFNYGPYAHFTGADSYDWDKSDRAGAELLVKNWGGQIRSAQMSWISSDLESNSCNRLPGQVGVLFSHHNPLLRNREIWPSSDLFVRLYWKQYDAKHDPQKPDVQALGMTLALRYDDNWRGEGANELLSLMNRYDVSLALHGHTHVDDVAENGEIESVTTTSLELGGSPWVGYRLFEIRDGEWTSSHIYDESDSSTPIYSNGDTAAGVMAIEAVYDNVNDGTQVFQGIALYNRLNRPVVVNVPCYMSRGIYSVIGGTVESGGSSGNVSHLDVSVAVGAGSTARVLIQ